MTAFLPAVFGALIVIGLIGMVYALIPAPPKPPRPTRTLTPFGRAGGWFARLNPRTRMLIISGALAGLLVALLTGWVIAIVLVPAAIVGIPLLLTPPPAAASIEKLEALEEWTRSLSGKLTAGQSLRSALIKSLQSVPAPIEREVGLMVSRLWNNTASTEDVLRAFAEDLNDSTGDVVASQLILAASGRGQAGLAKALDALAETVAADVRARRQIAADQAKPRTTARTVTVITLGVLGMLALTGDYIEPYGTPLGQIIRTFLLPRRDYVIEDTWDTVGLAGTGSHDIVVAGAFVPTDFTLSMTDTGRCYGPGQEVNDGDLYKLPFHSLFTSAITTPIIGMAYGAYEEHVAIQRERVRAAFIGERAAEDPFSNVRIARAASEVDAAWALLVQNLRELQGYVARGEKIPLEARLKVRRDQVCGTERAIDSIDLMFNNAGARALDRGSHLQRAWRDAHAGRVHAANDPDRALRMYGAHAVGQKLEPGMY